MTATTTRLRSINPIAIGLVLGIMYALFGVLVALFFMAFGGMMMATVPMYAHGFGGLGIFSLVIFPVIYFVGGFLGGLVTAALFNLVAGWVGGVELTFESSV